MTKFLLLIIALLSFSCFTEEVVVIVHPSNTNEITTGEASRIFSGRARTFSDGNPAVPFILPSDNSSTTIFNDRVFGVNTTQLNSRLSRRIFTTRGSPSRLVIDDSAMLEMISKDPDGIGYLSREFLDDSVKVVIKL